MYFQQSLIKNGIRLLMLGVLLSMDACRSARSQPPLDYWQSEVKNESWDAICKEIDDPSLPTWPTIISPYAAQQLAGDQKSKAVQGIELATATWRKMTADFDPKVEQGPKELEVDVKNYTSFAKALDHVGGYGNLLMADAALRLAVFRVSGWVAFHPDDTSESEKLISMLVAPQVNVKELLDHMSDQDADIYSRKGSIDMIGDKDDLYKAYMVIGMNVLNLFEPATSNTGKLLKEPSVARLVLRMAQTDDALNVALKGTLRFFQLGGQYAELDPKDIRPFVQRMGREAKSSITRCYKRGNLPSTTCFCSSTSTKTWGSRRRTWIFPSSSRKGAAWCKIMSAPHGAFPKCSVVGAAGSTLVLLHQVHLLLHRFIHFIRTSHIPIIFLPRADAYSPKPYRRLV